MTNNQLNVIFPVAGDGMRFGGDIFKPFLDATEKKFIELAQEPFNIFAGQFDITYYFIYRQDQEETFSVSKFFEKLFPNLKFKCVILPERTKGPLETLQQGIKKANIRGLSFICDCDHMIRVQPFQKIFQMSTLPDISIPVWDITDEEQGSWAKVTLALNNKIVSYHEKEKIPYSPLYKVKGIIGCYLFKNVEILLNYESQAGNMTEVFTTAAKDNLSITTTNIEQAEFFGTPEQLIHFRFLRARKYTFFVDIDGVLFYLPKHVPYEATDTQVLPGCLEKLKEWKKQGHRVVLTTGRETSRREKLIKQLTDLQVPYDDLVTGTNSGTRILINDKKPYCPFHKMAVAVQLPRNQGIGGVTIEDTPDLLKTLKGGSFASVFLIKKNKTLVVRKYLEKTKENHIHYETLKRQVDDLKRFEYYSPGIVPKILEVYESPDEYYFDMEYLEHYDELVTFPYETVEQKLPKIIERLKSDIYCYRKKIDGKKWLNDFLQDKIFAKYEMIEAIDTTFYKLVNNDYIMINDKKVKGLRYYFKTDKLEIYPSFVSPIHGDLTLENILYNPITEDYKLIDQSGARYVDPYEFDVAKLLQSLLAKYSEWDTLDQLCKCKDNNEFLINERLLDLQKDKYIFFLREFEEDTDALFRKGVFFLSMYLIRMIPFLLKKSKQHAYTGLLLSLYYLNENSL
jgi:hydroxymethylpyrimidine pyrophosphatase-like HAD family hydrolase